MRLVVFGATGRTGQDLVTRALGHGHKVTAFARRPDELDDRHADLRIVQGDITDAAAVAAAVEAQDAVVSTLVSAKPWRHTPAIVRGVAVIIAAAKTAGVQRFVYQSALGVGESRYAVRGTVLGLMIPLMLKKAYEDHAVDEQALRDSGLAWTIVRPTLLSNGPATGRWRSGPEVKDRSPFAHIARTDVAAYLLNTLERNLHVRQAVNLVPSAHAGEDLT